MGLFDKLKNKNIIRDNYFNYVGKLPKVFEIEIARMIDLTPKVFNIKGSNGKEIVEQINDIVDELLEKNTFPKEYADIEDVAVSLGIYYASVICDYYHWSWEFLGNSAEKSLVSIVSPNKYYSIQPMNYMLRILTKNNIGLDGRNDNTTLLLFNMLKNVESNKPEKNYTPIM